MSKAAATGNCRLTYHRFLRDRAGRNFGVCVSADTGSVHGPRYLIVVYPSDVLDKNYWLVIGVA